VGSLICGRAFRGPQDNKWSSTSFFTWNSGYSELFSLSNQKTVALEHVSAFDEWLPGAQKNFTEIFNIYYKRLCLYAFQFVKDKDTAKDIVQESFLKLWLKRRDIDLSYSPTSLLYTIVRNTTLNYLKSNKHRAKCIEAEEQLADDIRIDEFIFAETVNMIHMATALLPPKCRDIFQLLYIEGKDNLEIAKKLNISQSTIRVQKAKAISFIRQYFIRASLIGFFLFFA
jgi:RNA polymerase sigma-70 factor (ECF subfamily)